MLVLGLGLMAAGLMVFSRREFPAPVAPAGKEVKVSAHETPSRTARKSARRAAVLPGEAFLRGWAATSAAIQAESDPMRGEELMRGWVEGMAHGDIPAALDALEAGNQDDARRDLAARLLRRWAEQDPASAGEWVMRLEAGPVRTESINGLSIVWAGQDLAVAVAWARQLPDLGERQSALLQTAYETARTAPEDALTLAGEINAGPAREDLITHAAMQWAAVEPEKAAKWARGIPGQPMRERVVSAIAAAWGDSDPVAAAGLALASLSPGRLQDEAVIGIVQRWVQDRPEAATAWVDRFPEGELRESALAILAGK
jgi:hypothetical protein